MLMDTLSSGENLFTGGLKENNMELDETSKEGTSDTEPSGGIAEDSCDNQKVDEDKEIPARPGEDKEDSSTVKEDKEDSSTVTDDITTKASELNEENGNNLDDSDSASKDNPSDSTKNCSDLGGESAEKTSEIVKDKVKGDENGEKTSEIETDKVADENNSAAEAVLVGGEDDSVKKVSSNDVAKDKNFILNSLLNEGKENQKNANEGKKLNEDFNDMVSLLHQSNANEKTSGGADEETFSVDDEFDDMDDFDPSLLCPEVSMDIEEAPVNTNSGGDVPNDGSASPLPYEPVFSTFVDEMTGAEVMFNLTPEEQSLREKLYGEANPIKYARVHCSACNVHLGSSLDGQKNRFVHPMLKVLVCKDCYHFYTSGEFEKDEDGSELYCRWCGQGGQVLCCSNCEFVFCKKCIRINFGQKKLREVRDSDDWRCFRCEPSQLVSLRAMCYELFEYVRNEISRASTLNVPSFLTTDHSRCCLANTMKKKLSEAIGSELVKPKKRRMNKIDPDYNPLEEKLEIASTSASYKNDSNNIVKILPKQVMILPKPAVEVKTGAAIVGQLNKTPMQSFRVGNTNFNRVGVSPVQPMNKTPVRGIRLPNNSGLIRVVAPRSPQIKHEWFEKTVRAAARVNSNLSYTLTQLNRAQSQASSVEALAVVHNKLQEILSTSINSLIQIRKNLRTEFIAGIKTIKFPAKTCELKIPKPNTTEPAGQDDDVIFVNDTTTTTPPLPTLVPASTSRVNTLLPAVTLTTVPKNPNTKPILREVIMDDGKPKFYLKVKSFSALQNVTSECITIPDDPLPPLVRAPPPLFVHPQIVDCKTVKADKDNDKTTKVVEDVVEVVENGDLSKSEGVNGTESLQKPEEAPLIEEIVKKPENGTEAEAEVSKIESEDKSDFLNIVYNVKENPSEKVKHMLSAKVFVTRLKEIDEMLKKKQEAAAVNGEVSD